MVGLRRRCGMQVLLRLRREMQALQHKAWNEGHNEDSKFGRVWIFAVLLP